MTDETAAAAVTTTDIARLISNMLELADTVEREDGSTSEFSFWTEDLDPDTITLVAVSEPVPPASARGEVFRISVIRVG